MAARWTVAELTKDIKVHIHVEQMAIFVLRNGTIVSFSQDPGMSRLPAHRVLVRREGSPSLTCTGYHPTFSSIFDRISSPEDIIRESEDSSMILQAMLDIVGDAMLEIVDEFRSVLGDATSSQTKADATIVFAYREQLTTLESHVLSRPVSLFELLLC